MTPPVPPPHSMHTPAAVPPARPAKPRVASASSAWTPFVRDVPPPVPPPVRVVPSACDFVRALHALVPHPAAKQNVIAAFRFLQTHNPQRNLTRPVLSMHMARVCGSAPLVEAAWSFAGMARAQAAPSVPADAWTEDEPAECVAEGTVPLKAPPRAVKTQARATAPVAPPQAARPPTPPAPPLTCRDELGAAAAVGGVHPSDDMGVEDCFSQEAARQHQNDGAVETAAATAARNGRPHATSLALQRREWRARISGGGAALREPSLRVMLLKRRARMGAARREAHVRAVQAKVERAATKARLAAQLALRPHARARKAAPCHSMHSTHSSRPPAVPKLASPPTSARARPDDMRMEVPSLAPANGARKRKRAACGAGGTAGGLCACDGAKRCKRCRDAERRRHDMERRDLRCVTCGTNASTGYWRGASTPTPTCASCVRRESRARVRAKRMRAEQAAKAASA